ncbi:neuroglobin-like [Oppia nitens]|uniref:neuroglobin-like n=1 Tax=Oppia nitens TaxID=1686743 RepID=UPI0023DAAA5E|nr:neuroglobin-like [Oppia nitens]XP_054153957.1 neuroglobin-like [Oppia nitens]XP_054153958.1 neuroglobin-like [Oppia nitens]
MGCPLPKPPTTEYNTATNRNTPTNTNQSDQPLADPRLPLNVRQKFNISKSWKGIARAMERTGITMFVKLFEDNRDLLSLFEKFQTLKTRESQMESMELAEHASLVMTSLDEAINSLDNVDYFIEYLHSIGKLHHKVPGFQKDYFWKIETPFLEAVKETLDERYTENMENIYKIIIKFILQTLVDGYDSSGGDKKDAITTKTIEVNVDVPNES